MKLRITVIALVCITAAYGSEKPRLGGYVENATALYLDSPGLLTDIATLRLEGSWEFAKFGGVETHVLVSAALQPLDPFSLMRESSVISSILADLLAVSTGPFDSLLALEMAGLDPATQAWLGQAMGLDLEPFIRHLPYSSFWPRNTLTLDRAVVKLYFKRLDIYVGRQIVAWGTGYGWNPTDIWNVKNPVDPKAQKTGVNAIRAEVPFGAASGLSAVVSAGSDIDHTSGGVRAKGHFGRFEMSLSGMRVYGDDEALLGLPVRIIAGADLAGELGDIGVWGECAVVNPVYPGGEYTSVDSLYVQADIGLNYTFDNGLFVMGEYYYNGLGRRDPEDYSLSDLLRIMGAHMPGFGRHYAMMGATYTVRNAWTLSLFGLGNLTDISFMALPSVEYDFRGSIAAKLGANLAFGDRRSSEYGGLYHSVALIITGYF